MSDPRKNLPSASSAEADELCPGRFLAQQGLPEEESEDADSGTRVHLAFQGKDVNLSDFERETVDRGIEIEGAVLTKWLEQSAGAAVSSHREKRLFSHNPETLKPRCSGQADAFWISGKRALLEDLKSLFGDIPSAPRNKQLRDLAALLWENYGVQEITAFINQPRVTQNPVLVVYQLEDLLRAHREMITRVARSVIHGQPRIPGHEQCKYCRAKTACPEAQSVVVALSTEQSKLRWDLVTPAEKLKLYDACKMAAKFIEAIERKIKEELEGNAAAIPGLKLEPGAERRNLVDGKTINDVYNAIAFESCPECRGNELTKAACQRCGGKGRVQIIPAEDFVSACGVKIAETETLFRKVKGLKSKDATVEFNNRLSGIVAKKPTASSIARVSGIS